MRNTFIDELVQAAHKNSNIALVVGDLGYSVVEPFADQFPDRFLNAGVAEQNMTGLAAGMASEGYHVFTYSIANFPIFRCAEHIRNDIDYHKLPVTVVSVGGGCAYGALGYSHHAVQDYAFMRSLPNMIIAAPGDPMEVRSCIRYLISNPGPSYLRLGKSGELCFHSEPPTISPGKWLQLRWTESSKTILCTGACMQVGAKWIESEKFKEFGLHSVPLWSMKSKALQKSYLRKFKKVITIEDHLVDGGFASWLLEAQAMTTTNRIVEPVALNAGICGSVGSQQTLNLLGGLYYKN